MIQYNNFITKVLLLLEVLSCVRVKCFSQTDYFYNCSPRSITFRNSITLSSTTNVGSSHVKLNSQYRSHRVVHSPPSIQNGSKLYSSKLNNEHKDNDDSIIQDDPSFTRRKAIVAAMAGLNAESSWKTAVAMASSSSSSSTISTKPTTTITSSSLQLPSNTIELLQAGKAVIVPNWLSLSEVRALREDAKICFQNGEFTNFILSRNPNKIDKAANDRWIMPSFPPNQMKNSSGNIMGPFANPEIGSYYPTRVMFKAKMAQVKAFLSQEFESHDNNSDNNDNKFQQSNSLLAEELEQSHEMEYLRYGPGAFLQRHTDEHHVELKRPNGSRLPKKPNASRRSVTWMVYLNEDWDVEEYGGQLRLHERTYESDYHVGSNGNDLQVGWLKAMKTPVSLSSTAGATTTALKELPEQPVFLDPFQPGPENETCMLYTMEKDPNQSTQRKRRNLSSKPFANIALYLGGGDTMARKLMVDNPLDASRLHLIDAPKSLVSSIVPPRDSDSRNYQGEDGGETIREVSPQAGTLVMFDSVSLPHEVLVTKEERFGIQGWFHEKLGYS